MKKVNLNVVAKKFFLGNILAAALFISMHASASTSYKFIDDAIDTAKANKLEVKYVGNISNNLSFDICYLNARGTNFSFVIKDENGEIIFEKMYDNKQFHKTVELAKNEDIKGLNFSIYSNEGTLLQSRDVVINTKFVEDVLVKIN